MTCGGHKRRREHFSDRASEFSAAGGSGGSKHVCIRFMDLPAMHQNQQCVYPQVFWTNSSAVSGSDCNAPGLCRIGIVPHQDVCRPLPMPRRKRLQQSNKDSTCLCFLVVFLLNLLALTGIGLAMFQIVRLQHELDAVREVTPVHLMEAQHRLEGGVPGTCPQQEQWCPVPSWRLSGMGPPKDRAVMKNSMGWFFLSMNVCLLP